MRAPVCYRVEAPGCDLPGQVDGLSCQQGVPSLLTSLPTNRGRGAVLHLSSPGSHRRGDRHHQQEDGLTVT